MIAPRGNLLSICVLTTALLASPLGCHYLCRYQSPAAADAETDGEAIGDGPLPDSPARADRGATADAPPLPDAIASGQVVKLLADPFADGSAFAFVFQYNGQVYLGHNRNGTGAVRLEPTGLLLQSVAFALPADTQGDNTTRNSSAAPYPSIGQVGCAMDTAHCGPDNEDGRGLFTAGWFHGKEWLVAAGGRTEGDLDYLYMMSSDVDATLGFRYVDLSTRLGPQTRGSSAAHFFNDRVYFGFPDTGAHRPYLVVLKSSPGSPGLDVTTAAQAENLQADQMPAIGLSAATSMIDGIIDFNDRIYVFNNGGCVRSTTATPAPYGATPPDWRQCTPTAAEFSAKQAIEPSKVVDIEPADKAFPQLAVFKGSLYAGRNTESGPQLWVCKPGLTGYSTACEPNDWHLTAPNTVGDPALSQFNNPNNVAISMVIATAEQLVVGFDNAVDGIVVLRSSQTSPQTLADFSGQSGCAAELHPANCQGFGGNGFGEPPQRRIFDAMATSLAGAEALYLTAGDGSGPVSVFRLDD